jgi:hypothetical protein
LYVASGHTDVLRHADGVTDGPIGYAALSPSRFALWRDKSPRQEGPDLLLRGRACGDAVEERDEVVPILHRDATTEADTRLTRSGRSVLSAEASAKAESAGTESLA